MSDLPVERASSRALVPQSPTLADLKAGLIVFFVALPLCLGIATASGAPPLTGLIAGVVGGTVVALASRAQLSVGGPAAGLTVIVYDAIELLGLPGLLTATMLAGLIQIALGALQFGRLAQIVPNAVIRGMLAAIGLILVLKQLPHAVGYDADFEGDFAFGQRDGHNTFSELVYAMGGFNTGAICVTLVSAAALFAWRDYPTLKLRRFLPRELAAVLAGLGVALAVADTPLALSPEHLVRIPLLSRASGLGAWWTAPDLSLFATAGLWKVAFTLAIVASIESLLSVEATDRLDPYRRLTPPNRELMAQGLGNFVSGSLGGLPVTAVVVRSFTNVEAGGRTRWASFTHGVLLFGSILLLAEALNHIPLAALAVVLLAIGAKLTPPSLYRQTYQLGSEQFVPFVVTVACIVLTDLLSGVLLGLAFAVFFVVYREYRSALVVTDDGGHRLIRFVTSASFLHKGKLKAALESAPRGSQVIIDATRARSIDADIIETLRDLERNAGGLASTVTIQRSSGALHPFLREET